MVEDVASHLKRNTKKEKREGEREKKVRGKKKRRGVEGGEK